MTFERILLDHKNQVNTVPRSNARLPRGSKGKISTYSYFFLLDPRHPVYTLQKDISEFRNASNCNGAPRKMNF